MMVLTGNSTNRIKQLYLTNPNSKYDVQLEVMIGIIDDNYSFFNDTLNQSGTSFTGLEYTDIASYIVGESIVINDKSSPVKPLIYILLNNIQSIEKTGSIIIIDDSGLGTIFLQFLTENDAFQAQSLLNYVLENPNVNISNIDPLADSQDPIVYFYSKVGASASLDYIAFNGATSSSGFDTGDGFTFSTTISLTQSGTVSGTILDKNQLIYLLIDEIVDIRDGYMYMMPSNLIITGTAGVSTSITHTGTYSLTFDFSDIAQNYLDGVVINLNVTA